ncbi:MAG: DUF481 domain-containing protein [Planctomycetota bacterium]
MKRLIVSSLLLWGLVGGVYAQDDPTTDPIEDGETPVDVPEVDAPEGAEVEAGELSPPGTLPSGLVLKNGEALRGSLVGVSDGTVTYTSESVGEQKVPLAQVESLNTEKVHEVVMPGGGTLRGQVQIVGEQVIVTPEDGSAPVTFALADLTAINPAPEKTELDYWTFTGTLGASATYGNTRTRTFFALASVDREDENTHFRLAYTGVYAVDASKNGAGETAKSHRGDFQFDVNITERFYVTPVVGHLLYDKFANIELRGSIGAGVGYKIFIKEHLKWRVEAGGSYSETRVYRESPNLLVATQTPPEETPPFNQAIYSVSARVASNFYWKLNDRLTLDAFWESYIGVKDLKDTFHRGTFNIGYQISGNFALGLGGIYDRVETPGRRANGSPARRDDFKATLTLSFTF